MRAGILSTEFEEAREYKPQARDWLSSYWSGYNSPSQLSRIRNTGVPLNFLKEVRWWSVRNPLHPTMDAL